MSGEVPRLDSEEFRREAHRVADWIADYFRDLAGYRVQPDASPGAIARQIPAQPPREGTSPDRIMEDFQRIVVPGLTHWNHPGFYGYFPANTSPPSVLAEMLVAGLGVQGMSWSTSPAATELEQAMMSWLRQMIGLPETFTGVIQDTASSATLVALITARDRSIADLGVSIDRLTVYASEEANSSVPKGARLAGVRPGQVRLIPTDDQAAMRMDALEAAMARDREAGLVPCCVVATVGTTGSTGIDPVATIGSLCRETGLWLHIDAAFAGSAAILPEMRWVLEGADQADSLVFNPHKWLLVNFDCSAYFVRDTVALRRSFGATAEILRNPQDDRVANFRDWGIQLGRRFRALKLWFVIRSYGVEGLQAMVREHIRLGKLFASWLDSDPRFERIGTAELATVCFRLRGEGSVDRDAINRDLLRRINETGRIFLTGTVLKGRFVLRLALGHLSSTEAHLEEAWSLIRGLVGAS